ncbi:MAG: heavy-metal-associated domain-containing protein [Bacteroidales bacterium]|nr:heavy-metal-associated domain-containing protein [Bacteroidales bacterium]HPO66143.1 heavy-metal-associated domain-containing protein [Bacteroidales bacterium]
MNNRKNSGIMSFVSGILNILPLPFIFSFMVLAFMMGPVSLQAQKSNGLKTETIKVWGNCESCKARIEKAAKTEGVTNAVWDIKTKMLTLTYDPSKTSSDRVQKQIAAVGHDTEKYKADDKTYNSLPGCCKYERSK